MFGNKDTTLKADLRKKSSIKDEIRYSDYDIQSVALLLSVISVVAATPGLL